MTMPRFQGSEPSTAQYEADPNVRNNVRLITLDAAQHSSHRDGNLKGEEMCRFYPTSKEDEDCLDVVKATSRCLTKAQSQTPMPRTHTVSTNTGSVEARPPRHVRTWELRDLKHT